MRPLVYGLYALFSGRETIAHRWGQHSTLIVWSAKKKKKTRRRERRRHEEEEEEEAEEEDTKKKNYLLVDISNKMTCVY